jgi:hypothetical protein
VNASETQSITDKLFQTVAMGKTTFSDLASNLATVAPIAAASAIPLEQILAHVAALTAQGTPTAQAMTQIRASIMGLNKALGDGWSGTMSYQDALKKVWQNAGQSQTKLLDLVGSSEAVQAVLGGVGINADMAAIKLKGMGDSAGAAEAAFEKVQQFRHWPALLETARGAVSKFGEEIDKRVRPYVLQVTEQIKKWRDDEGLWATIGSFMDSAVAQLDSVAKRTGDIVKQIKSVEDLKIVAEVIGNWMKEKLIEAGQRIAQFLIEKAPMVGDAIGRAIIAGMNAVARDFTDRYVAKQQMKQRGMETTPQAVDQYVHETRAAGFAAQGKELAAQIEISQGSQQSLSDKLVTALQARASQPENDSERLTQALENGLSGEALDKLVSGLELTAEDLELLAAYTEEFTGTTASVAETANQALESATKVREETNKSLSAVQQSHTDVQSSMRASAAAATATSQVSTQTVQVAQQVVAVQALQAGQLSSLCNEINRINSQLRSMRA